MSDLGWFLPGPMDVSSGSSRTPDWCQFCFLPGHTNVSSNFLQDLLMMVFVSSMINWCPFWFCTGLPGSTDVCTGLPGSTDVSSGSSRINWCQFWFSRFNLCEFWFFQDQLMSVLVFQDQLISVLVFLGSTDVSSGFSRIYWCPCWSSRTNCCQLGSGGRGILPGSTDISSVFFSMRFWCQPSPSFHWPWGQIQPFQISCRWNQFQPYDQLCRQLHDLFQKENQKYRFGRLCKFGWISSNSFLGSIGSVPTKLRSFCLEQNTE